MKIRSEQRESSRGEVQKAFTQWRGERPTYRVPPALRAQAVELLAPHRVSDVLKALGLDQRRIGRWRREELAASGTRRR